MTKINRTNWIEQTSDEDYAAAEDYLSLLLPKGETKNAIASLRDAPLVHRYARDLLRASGLGALPVDNPDVSPKMKKLKKGVLLSPVLALRGHLRSAIADGHHRICASYLLDETAEIPCRMAVLPR